jgi:cytidine deaminase
MGVADPLVERARSVRDNAYAPYSGFRVGAAVEAEDGTVFVGCNVESGSYGLTICAERAAVGAAVAAGHTRFRRVALSTDGARPVPPCGGCRQVLSEFGLDLVVLSEAGGEVAEWALRDLFPEPFLFDKTEKSDPGTP